MGPLSQSPEGSWRKLFKQKCITTERSFKSLHILTDAAAALFLIILSLSPVSPPRLSFLNTHTQSFSVLSSRPQDARLICPSAQLNVEKCLTHVYTHQNICLCGVRTRRLCVAVGCCDWNPPCGWIHP